MRLRLVLTLLLMFPKAVSCWPCRRFWPADFCVIPSQIFRRGLAATRVFPHRRTLVVGTIDHGTPCRAGDLARRQKQKDRLETIKARGQSKVFATWSRPWTSA